MCHEDVSQIFTTNIVTYIVVTYIIYEMNLHGTINYEYLSVFKISSSASSSVGSECSLSWDIVGESQLSRLTYSLYCDDLMAALSSFVALGKVYS